MRIFLIFLSATMTLFTLHSGTFLSQTISGNLFNRWIIEFEIFVNDFGGYILNCEDSKENKFHILIKGQRLGRIVAMKYNTNQKSQRLSTFCQCYLCQNITVRMRIMLKDGALQAQCNSATTEMFFINSFKRKWSQHNLVTISMGKSRRYSYRSSRMVGCLRSLHFNKIPIEFTTKKNQDDYLTTEDYFYDCNRIIGTTKSLIVAIYHGDVTRVAESMKSIPTTNKIKEQNYSINATSHHHRSESNCTEECIFWKWFAILEILSIMGAILYINRRNLIRSIKKTNQTSPIIEVAVHESNHNEGGQSAYSSLNTGLPNPNRLSILGSDDSYMIPRMPSLVENRPSLPPRKDKTIFKRIEHMISDPRPKSYVIPNYRLMENNWTSFIESLDEEENNYIYIKK